MSMNSITISKWHCSFQQWSYAISVKRVGYICLFFFVFIIHYIINSTACQFGIVKFIVFLYADRSQTRDIHLRFHAHRSIALHRLTERFQRIVNLMIYLPSIHPPYTIHLVTYFKKKQDRVAYIMLKKSKM